jgi:hypothetical protein
MQDRLNSTELEKPKEADKRLSQCPFLHQNPKWTGLESNVALREVMSINRLSQGNAPTHVTSVQNR